jgi:hypothetical protein
VKTKEQVIYDMCMTFRHDYGLRKLPSDPAWVAGMTEQDAKMLYNSMEQVYTNNVEPILKYYENKK